MPLVAVVMGSKSDAETVQPMLDILKQLKIDFEVSVISTAPEPGEGEGICPRSPQAEY